MIKHISHRIFITVFILIGLHATPDGPQTNRYTDAIHSFVNFGTFALQKGYRSHIDILLLNNNAYSVIPPGIPILLAPIYFIHQMLMRVVGIPVGRFTGQYLIYCRMFASSLLFLELWQS
ncbi:hypothetical protein [Scytonema sp. PRP1]|uniref:hypothetical protein n=1 Tax=Scytonema sp. PRP1 TaxID=3120513 RepID=UPI002FD1536A